MAFDGVVWNEALPDNSTLAHQIDDYDRDLRIGVRARMDREHIWPASQTGTDQGGHHRFITLQAQTAAPTLLADSGQAGCLYLGSSAAGYPLMFENSAGSTVTLVSSNGSLGVVTTGTLGAIPICSGANPNALTTLAGPTSTTATTWTLISSNDATGGVAAPLWSTDAISPHLIFTMGTGSHGTVVSPPSGFTAAQCKLFLPTMYAYPIGEVEGRESYIQIYTTGTGLQIHAIAHDGHSGAGMNGVGYLLIASK